MVFSIGVTFDTPPEKLHRINQIIQDIFTNIPTARLDRVHFNNIGQSSLNYEIAYYVKSADYSVAMSAQQEVNLSLIEHFAHEKIEFAFPTRTLYLVRDENALTGQ